MSTAPVNNPIARRAPFPFAAVLLILLTAVLSLLWSRHKLMSQDEFFVLQTDSVSTVSQLIHIQRHFPISLDPLVYHLLAHAAMRVFGVGAFALRLPALLGYLLMQVCLFLFVRRLADERAGIFALAFPAITATLFYSAEGRPYGLLLGFYALTLWSWQTAIRRSATTAGDPSFRDSIAKGWGALMLLALAIALTLNSHYFGILLLIPLCAAELSRTIQRRLLDLPVIAAIVAGMAAIVFALPFQQPAAEFRKHYYNGGTVSLHAVTQSYRALFVDYTHTSLSTQRVVAIAFVVFALALIAGCVYRLKRSSTELPRAEIVFAAVLAALPFFGYLLARFATHSIEVRYVLGAIIGVSVLLAITLAPVFRRELAWRITLALLFIAIGVSGMLRIHAEIRTTEAVLASLVPSQQLKAAILASPDQLLYVQDMGHFEVASYYSPDAFVRSHMALLYSRDEELRWDQHDTVSLTAMHMRFFTGFPIVQYEQLRTQPGPHVLVLFHSGWDWTDQALAEDHAQTAPLGPALDGDAVSVRFPQ
jgi:4-amino-4-deoxy-L-arabinose transferase-like glycosyltransferase